MPSVDYRTVPALISIEQVLELISFHPTESDGDELRGKCPLHASASTLSRSFAANIRKNAFRCFRCGASGNQLDLWAAYSRTELYPATIDLCTKLNVEVPRLPGKKRE